MSLLMDALRRAEESKKKAEKSGHDDAVKVSPGVIAEAETPGPESAAVTPVTLAKVPPRAGQAATPARAVSVLPPSIPDTLLEFAATESPQRSRSSVDPEPLSQSGGMGPDTDPTDSREGPALELAPRDQIEPRQPLMQPPGADKPPAPELQSTGGRAATAVPEASAPTSSSGREVPGGGKAPGRTADKTVKSPLVAEPARASISEQSASHRARARTILAAKHPGRVSRQRLLAVIGAGLVVVLFVGFVFVFLSNQSSRSGIQVPANVVAGEGRSTSVESAESTGGIAVSPLIEDAADDFPIAQNTTSVVSIATPVDMPAPAAGAATLPASFEPVAAEPEVDLFVAPEAEALAVAPSPTASAQDIAAPPAPGAEPTIAATDAARAPVAEVGSARDSQQAAQEQEAIAVQEPAAAAIESISFVRRQQTSTIEPLLREAYTAYQQGDTTLARTRYQSVLNEMPLHRDALLGLAAIASAEEQPAQAMEYYSRLLARNPTDPVARAGILELSPSGGPAEQERELRRLQERHPGVGPLAYAFGNFYASRSQWSDAQQQYFRALQLARANASEASEVNPDYAYNLAVSLEHLNQPRAALSFYREALEQASRHRAGFDANSVRARVAAISGTQP